MCVLVQVSDSPAPTWDAEAVTLTIPAHLNQAEAARCVRAFLAAAGAPQPELGAVCTCGDPVKIPHMRAAAEAS